MCDFKTAWRRRPTGRVAMGGMPQSPQFQQLGQDFSKLMQPVQAYEQQHQPGMVHPQGLTPPAQGGGAPAMAPAQRAPSAWDA